MNRLYSRLGVLVLTALPLLVACTDVFGGTNLFQSQANRVEEPPYPPSTVIADVFFDRATHDRRAPGSDNWPITWAADDHQYTNWGDGGGFEGTNRDERVSLGVARVEGDWHNYAGYNVWGGKESETPAQFGGKSYGMLAIDELLYMWVSPGSNAENYSEARLAESIDNGITWTQANWAFKEYDSLVLPTFCQFGRGYIGARDDYVYSYAIRLKDNSTLQVQKPGQIDLLRVPKDKVMRRHSYEFFAGLDVNSEPTWTNDLADRSPVFEDRNGVGWNVSVSFNPGLNRYVLATEHTQSFQGNLGIFDAPEPWGPWTTVGYYYNWEDFSSTFFWNFSNKWLSSNGKDFTIVFTGTGSNDSWNTMRGKFTADRN